MTAVHHPTPEEIEELERVEDDLDELLEKVEALAVCVARIRESRRPTLTVIEGGERDA